MINYFSNVLKPIILSGIIALFVGTYVFDLLDYEFRYIVLILLIIGIIAIVLIRKIDGQFPFVNSIIAFRKNSRTALLLFVLFLLVIGFFSESFPQPEFYTTHELLICPDDVFFERGQKLFAITSVKRTDERPIFLTEFKGTDSWNLENGILIAQKSGTCAHYLEYFRGGISLTFESGPDFGNVQVVWDGESSTISLESKVLSTKRISLAGQSPGETSIARLFVLRLSQLARLLLFFITAIWMSGSIAFLHQGKSIQTVSIKFGFAALILISILSLLTLSQIGKHAGQLVSDDFCYAANVGKASIWDLAWNRYNNLHGRIGAHFVDGLAPTFRPNNLFRFTPAILLFSLSALASLIWKQLFRVLGMKKNILASILMGFVTILITFQSAPEFNQVIYWRSGRNALVPGIYFLMIQFIFILKYWDSRNWRIRLAVATFTLSILAASFHEVIAAAQMGFWLALSFGLIIGNKAKIINVRNYNPTLFAGILGSLGGTVIYLLSPGTYVRSEALGSFSSPLISILDTTLYYTSQFSLFRGINILSLAYFGMCIYVSYSRRTSKTNQILAIGNKNLGRFVFLLIPFVIVASVAAGTAVGAVAFGKDLPERSQFIINFYYIFGTGLFGFICGWAFAPLIKEMLKHMGTIPYISLIFALVVIGFSIALTSVSLNKQILVFDRYTNRVELLREEVNTARRENQESHTTRNLPQNPFGLLNPSSDNPNTFNGCISRYFDITIEYR